MFKSILTSSSSSKELVRSNITEAGNKKLRTIGVVLVLPLVPVNGDVLILSFLLDQTGPEIGFLVLLLKIDLNVSWLNLGLKGLITTGERG